MKTTRDKAIAFFLEHAGYSYDPKTETEAQGKQRSAERLADAEAWARANDLRVYWEHEDEDPRDVLGEFCTADSCKDPYCRLVHGNPNAQYYWAVLRDENQVDYASLGMIEDPTREYRRVIEAELALEAMPETEVA